MTIWLWIGFIVMILGFLALDLGVFNRTPHVVHTREALAWTGVWVFVALLFNVFIYFAYDNHWFDIGLGARHTEHGGDAALEYFTGYVVEKSLSLDNIFVIAVIFGFFRVPAQVQHRVLFWGVLGALVLRGLMIGAGAALIHRFEWMTYVFGGILIVTAIKMLVSSESDIDPDKNLLVRLARRIYPVSRDFEGEHFFTRVDGKAAVTPLFLVLLVVESTDVLFAVDSIPAIFAVTQDPFLVFTSNVFAILGLRSLYFALASLMDKFRYLKLSLVFVLAFVGVKMILAPHKGFEIPTHISLAIIVGMLVVGVLASLTGRRRGGVPEGPSGPAEPPPPRRPRGF